MRYGARERDDFGEFTTQSVEHRRPYSGFMAMETGIERDVLVLAKTVAANECPVERPGVIAQDRASGALLRLAPFPWKGADTDPPIQRWAWLQLSASRDERDPRPETHTVGGEIIPTGYVEAKEGWRLRWPFVRPHLRASVEGLIELSRARSSTIGFVRPEADIDIVQLPLRLRFRCASEDCEATHEMPVLDWELHSLAQATRAKYGPSWATKFRETWGTGLADRGLGLGEVEALFVPLQHGVAADDALFVASFIGTPAMDGRVLPLADRGRARVERHPLVDIGVIRLSALGIRFPV